MSDAQDFEVLVDARAQKELARFATSVRRRFYEAFVKIPPKLAGLEGLVETTSLWTNHPQTFRLSQRSLGESHLRARGPSMAAMTSAVVQHATVSCSLK